MSNFLTFTCARSGKSVTIRRDAILSAAPDFHTGETTWIISEGNQKAHVTESPEELSKLLEQPEEVEA